MRTRLLDDLEDDDPILSVVNLIDVFLVIIAALLIAVASHPLSPFAAGDATLIRNPGQQDMEIVVKKGDRISRFQGEGEASAGDPYIHPAGFLVKHPFFFYPELSDSIHIELFTYHRLLHDTF